jgi:2-aminoadipate transaminase
VPGGAFYADNPDPRTLRLSFVTLTPERIREGVGILGKVLRSAVPA